MVAPLRRNVTTRPLHSHSTQAPLPPPARWFAPALLALIGAAFCWCLYVTRTQYLSHHVYMADAGLFSYMMDSPWHGGFLVMPINPDVEGNFFGIHFMPVLLLFSPLYLLNHTTMTFLVVMVAAVAASAVPVALVARSRLRSDGAALAVAAAWLCNHFVASIHLANHIECLSLLAVWLLLLGVEWRHRALTGVGLLLALSVKEDHALYVFLLGVALQFDRERRRTGWVLMAGALAWALLAVIVMKACGAEAYVAAGNNPVTRFASMGETRFEIIMHILTNPLEMVQRLARPPLLALLASVGFLCLLDWRAVWIGLAGAAVFMITDDVLIRDLWYYYSYAAVIFLTYSAIRGAAVLKKWLERRQHAALTPRRIDGALIAVFVLLAVVQAPLPTRTDGLRRVPFEVNDRHLLVFEVLKLIPRGAPVAIQYDLYSFLPHREGHYPLRLEFLGRVEYAVADFQGRSPDLSREEAAAVFEVLGGPEWAIEFEGEGYVLYRRAVGP